MATKSGLLKPVQKYLALAQRMDSINPLVAYYCRKYALALGKDIPGRSSSDTMSLMSIMDRLEADKAKISDDTEQHRELLERMAEETFSRANDEDEAGDADKGTANKFRTASLFLDVLSLFGELSEELSQCRVFCKWKTMDIMKALKEGRKPTPGGFGADSGDIQDDEEDMKEPDPPSQQPPSSPISSSVPPSERFRSDRSVSSRDPHRHRPANRATQQPSQPIPEQFVIFPQTDLVGQERVVIVKRGEDLCKEALSALRFDDVDTAVELLRQAIGVVMVQYGQAREDDDVDLSSDSDEE